MPSIYKRICAEYQKTRTLPYNFMPEDIGATSVTAMLHNEMPAALKQVCAEKTWLAAFGKGQWSVIEVIWFANEFLQQARRRISEGAVTLEEAVQRGMHLAMGSDQPQAVEVGMLLMGLRQDDLTEHVMERLALHSKFTLIGLIACREWPDRNARTFRWLQNTRGCGSVVCALALRPENDEQRRWLIFSGMINARPRSEMARCILARPSMEMYILSLPDDAATFHALCRLVCYAPDMNGRQVRLLTTKLLRGLQHACEYIDLCAMHRVQRALLSPEEELYDQWAESCAPLRQRLRMRGVIEREMNDPQESAVLMSLVLTGERMTPPLASMGRMIAVGDLPDDMLRFMLLYHDDLYAESLLSCMMTVAPKILFDDPPTVRDSREYPDGRYDLWLARALGAMCGDPGLEEEVVLKCLGARLAAVRYQALRCLDDMSQGLLSGEAEKALRQAISQEPDPELRKRMQRLLGGMNPAVRERRRALLPEIDPEALRICKLGEPLRYVEISARERYNSDGVRDLLDVDERLLLAPKRGDENIALAVTPGGLVIGEIELDEGDAQMKRWLADGEVLIAQLEGTAYMEHMWAEIRRPLRSLALPARGIIRMFPMNK